MVESTEALQDDNSASQTTRVLAKLRQLILSGELAPGMRVVELAMVQRLNASRTPVRAALTRLDYEGLLEASTSGGYLVRGFSADDVADAIESRGALEGLAARQAAERGIVSRELREIRECLDSIDTILAKPEIDETTFSSYVELNSRFHQLLVGAAHSQVIERLLDQVMQLPFASPNGVVSVQAVLPEAKNKLLVAQAQHRAVVDAIVMRQSGRAEALMQEHARISLHNLRAAIINRRLDLLPGSALIRTA
jgi:GntR family transcriptional regulator of vanillate catabolism